MAVSTLLRKFTRLTGALIAVTLSVAAASPTFAGFDMGISGFRDEPEPVPAGGFITYTLDVENSGADPTPVPGTLKFKLDPTTVFQSVAPSANCVYSPGPVHEVNCDFGIMQGTITNPTATRPVQIVVRTTTPGVTNVLASVGPSGPGSGDGNDGNDSQPANTTVVAGADLRFQSYSATPSTVTAGAIVPFTAMVENLGPSVAVGLTVRFSLVPGIAYDSFSSAGGWSCSPSGTFVVCTNSASVAVGGVGPTLTWNAKITSGITGALSHSGEVSSATGDGNLSNNQTSTTITILAGTDLSIAKTVSADPVIGGSAVTFMLNATNNGPFPANTVQVSDTLPAGFTAIAASGGGWTCGVDAPTRVVTCARATMAVGSFPITVTATAPDNALIAAGGQNASNTALIQSATADAISSNDSGTVNFRLVKDGADLRVSMSRGPSPVPLNSDITTIVRATNNGPRVANGPFRITYQLAAGEQLKSFSGTDWSCSPLNVPGALVTCNRLAISGGLAVTTATNPLTLITQTATAGTVLGTACTSGSAGLAPTEGDIDASNDCISNDGSVLASATTADLRLSKAVAPGVLIAADGRLTYTLVVTNFAGDPATNVTLTDPIPMYSPAFNDRPASAVAAVVTGGTGGTCSGAATVTCDLGTVLVGTPKTVTVTVDRPMQSGPFRNTAGVYSSTIGDNDRSNNVASADVTINAVTDIELTSKGFVPVGGVKSGVEATYTITLRNNGPSAADNVVVTDTFAATGANGTYTFISATGTGGATCPTAPASGISAAFAVVCNFGSIDPFGVRSMTVKIRPDFMAAAPVGRQFQNTAVVTTMTPQQTPDPTPNSSLVVTLPVAADEIDLAIDEIDKDPPSGPVLGLLDPVPFDPSAPDTNLAVYQIEARNLGPSYATGVMFSDETTSGPAGKTLTFLCALNAPPPSPHNAATACASAISICTGTYPLVTCSIGDMPALTRQLRYLVYRVNNAPSSSGDTYRKIARIWGNENETGAAALANNAEEEQTTVRMLADMELVSKSAPPAGVNINEPFNWTVVARNNGPGTATITRITDSLPAGMQLFPTATTPAIAFSRSGAGASGTCPVTAGGTSFNCAVGDITTGAANTVTLTIPVRMTTFPSGGTISNTATIVTDSVDPISTNNSNSGNVTVRKSSLSCTVYHDINDDGVKQGTEPGISGVTVALSGIDAYGITLPSPLTAVTNGSGVCLFDNLPPAGAAGYTLTQTQPSGYVDGKDNSTGTAAGVIAGSKNTEVISGIALAANTNIPATQLTFGELQLASIGGRVWHDVNNNALIDTGENVMLDGITITLDGTDDLGASVNRTTSTAGGGIYSFGNLRPGTYRLTQTQPAAATGYLEGQARPGTGITGAATGTADNAPASASFGNVIANIQIQSGNAGVDYNFGELRLAQVAGIVWYDADNSGTKNGLETFIPAVPVTLTGTDYRGVTVTAQVVNTDSNGAYSFTSLKPGTYTITETQPPAYANGQTVLGTVNGTASGTAGSDVFSSVVLTSASAGINYNFGERGRGIAGTVYNDLNDNGIINAPGEVGIPNVMIRITGCGIDRTTQTDGTGQYSFAGLPDCPGGFTLTETQPAGFSDGQDTRGTAGGTVTNDQITGIVLGATTFATGYNFGEHGVVTTDVQCTSTTPAATARNVREPFNWTFTVRVASGGASPATVFRNTLPAGLEPFGATPALATPTLSAVPALTTAGPCTVATAPNTPAQVTCPIGYMTPGQTVTVTIPVRATAYPTTPVAGRITNVATISTDGTDTANNTCQGDATIQQSTIAGTVFEDPNNNGIREGSGATLEKGIGGVTLRLSGRDLYGNDISAYPNATTTTIATPGATLGTYQFTGLPPADASGYTITEVQPNGYADGRETVGIPSGGSAAVNDVISGILLGANINATGYDFAEIGQGLAGSVYVDSNNNGVRDPGEVGIPNVAIRVTGVSATNTSVDQTATTDADGNYLFGALPASNAAGFTIAETQPAAWADGKDKLGTLPTGTLGNDRFTRVVLPAGVVGTGYDFGEIGGKLCGYVYNDRNDNGLKDRNEAGIPGALVTLTGTDINGNAITRVATTAAAGGGADVGRYCVTDLPLPGTGGFSLNETQPVDTADGRDTVGTIGGVPNGTGGNDVITGIVPTTGGFEGQSYNFGERVTNGAAVSGYVWFDGNHDRVRDPTGRGGWTVELLSGTPGGATTVVATVVTDANGFYRIDGLPAGPGYSLQFRSPQGNYVYGFIPNVTLTAGIELTEQNQPIDPSGVVYDALTRAPVPGAVVRLIGPGGFEPNLHLVGGLPNVAQTTDVTGEYKFLLLPGAPAGVYRLETTVPTGYIQRVSTAIPACSNTLTVGSTPNPALVQNSDRAPLSSIPTHNPAACSSTSAGLSGGAQTTQYYLSLALSAVSANLINNHIPLERIPNGEALVVTKTTPKQEVSRGELVPYTITVKNNIDLRQTDVALLDQIPPGFQYRVGSATIDNVRREPVITGRQLTWSPLTIERGQTITLKLLLTVGTGVGTGEFVNQAWTANVFTGGVTSNVAKAVVRIVPDATFDCSEVIGKVFDDKNRNGVQDEGEPGIANARVVTVRGQLITTDSYGRYHIACADIPDEDRGSNFVLKLDERTLPTGYRLTTENPGMARLTRGKMSKINFGASIQRVVRLDLKDLAFEPNSSALRAAYTANLDQLLPLLQQEQSILRIAYGRNAQEDVGVAQSRMKDIVATVRAAWRQHGGRYPLAIETEVYLTGGGK
jgi:large repetitive protein